MKKHLTTPQLCSFKSPVMIYLQKLLKTFLRSNMVKGLLRKK